MGHLYHGELLVITRPATSRIFLREVPWDLLIFEAELVFFAEKRQESDKTLKDPLSDAGKLRADWNDME